MNSSNATTDWAKRYAEGNTPWDKGAAHPELVARLEQGELKPPGDGARVLVPGCGRGHDALALARAGWKVIAADLVVELADQVAGNLAPMGGEFLQGDILEWGREQPQEPVQLLFDHTFLCALELRDRPGFGELASRAVAVGGTLVSLLYPVGKPAEDGGPPFGLDLETLEGLLHKDFELELHEPVAHHLPDRPFEEYWARFKRVR